MPHFKDQQGGLHFLESAALAKLLPAGCVQITDAEADSIRNPPKTQAQIDAEISAQAKAALAAIDAASIRPMREWIASQPTAPQFLKDREAAAIAERAKIKP